MCGLAGIFKKVGTNISASTVEKMIAAISHRGPDDEGVIFLPAASTSGWQCRSESDSGWEVALGSCRLSILDLSNAGHMPMAYLDKFWIVYNGEV